MPAVFAKLVQVQDMLVSHVAEAKSVDFLVQQGRLWILQPRFAENSKAARRRATSREDVNDVVSIAAQLNAEATPVLRLSGGGSDDGTEELASLSISGLSAIAAGYAWSVVGGAWVPLGLDQGQSSAAGSVHSPAAGARSAGLGRRPAARPRRARRSRSAPASQREGLSDETSSTWTLSTKLPVWQTALAGGLAGVATQLAAGNPAACARALPTGALCCTGYVNCLNLASEDGDLDSVPVHKRLVCAGAAATAATATMHLAASALAATPARLALAALGGAVGRTVPTMAVEMTAIDVAKSALVKDGGEVTAGVLLASGAAAGVTSCSLLQPISAAACRVPDVRLPGKARVLAPIVRTMAPTLRRNVPGAAANSLVRVGMVGHFLASAGGSDAKGGAPAGKQPSA